MILNSKIFKEQLNKNKLLGKIIQTIICLTVWHNLIIARPTTCTHSLKVIDGYALDIPNAQISLDTLTLGFTDIEGNIEITGPCEGLMVLTIVAYGYTTRYVEIEAENGKETHTIEMSLADGIDQLQEVKLRGTRIDRDAVEKRSAAIKAEVKETGEYQNTNISGNELVNSVAGIRVRTSGGLGSEAQFNLNGLQGRAIKTFINGIPAEYLGAGFSLNNLPINLIKKIEIYKGVVPAAFSTDALGGVINLVTEEKQTTFLDLNYAFGSFNTHKTSLNTRYQLPKHKTYIGLSAYFNHSDNNYRIDNVPYIENFSQKRISARRFHDAFTSGLIRTEIGTYGRKWADDLSLGIFYTGYYDEIQHGITTETVFGDAIRKERQVGSILNYRKDSILGSRLSVSYTLLTAIAVHQFTDTSVHVWNWKGYYDPAHDRARSLPAREIGFMGSHTTANVQNLTSRLLLTYDLRNDQQITINNQFFTYGLSGNDLFRDRFLTAGPFDSPQYYNKMVTTAAYQKSLAKRFTTVTGIRNFMYRSRIIENRTAYTYEQGQETESRSWGINQAFKYNILKALFLRTAAEYSYRLPEADEIFGNNSTVIRSKDLRPEKGYSINLGATYDGYVKHLSLRTDLNLFHRNIKDMIQLVPANFLGQYQNIYHVDARGLEFDVELSLPGKYMFGFNITWQRLLYNNRTDPYTGQINPVYGTRVANIPYLLYNYSLMRIFNNFVAPKDQLRIYWIGNFTESFYLYPEAQGKKDQNKSMIPRQFINSTGVSYTIPGGKLSLGFDISNIYDMAAFDNFSVQKPGRAYAIKIRYFINKKETK